MHEPIGITKIIDHLQDDLETGYLQVKSPNTQKQDMQEAEGFIYILPRGHAILITKAMTTYHVSMQHVIDNKLKTGDHIKSEANEMGVHEITSIKHIDFDKVIPIRPHIKRKFCNNEIKLGERIIVNNKSKFDFVEFIAKNQSQADPSYKIVLLIDETEDCIEYLKENGTDEVYLAKVDCNIKKKILITISALLTAKKHAAAGKNVILFIDNINKLFKLYNSSIDANTVNTAKINIGPLTDLKVLFMEAKQCKDKGSLTIITNMLTPTSDLEKYVMDDFVCLSSKCLNLD